MIAALLIAAVTISTPPAPKTFVTDRVLLLHRDTRRKIETELHDFEVKTGDQVIVYIDDSLGGAPLEEWTVDAANAWKVGQKGKDNGVVLFIFATDRKARIEVGRGLDSTFTDAQASQIIRNVLAPELRDDDPDRAVQDTVESILRILDQGTNPKQPVVIPHEPVHHFNVFAAIGSFFHTLRYIFGAIILLYVIWYFAFGEAITWLRRGKKHGDWMDDYMDPIHQDIKAGETYASSGGGGGGSGGGGGGGFSGGGGSFGGGGASGGW